MDGERHLQGTMLSIPLLLLWLFGWVMPLAKPLPTPIVVEETAMAHPDAAAEPYAEIGLAGQLPRPVFAAGYRSVGKHGLKSARILAIADMTQPSTAKRLYIIDLERRELVLRSYVAHGQKTGDLMAERFSNRHGSHQTSLGLYLVGAEITSPKHGPALLLHGLDDGLNDQALPREVIIHGADYVNENFIRQHGRLGRSWGCPAVSRQDMPLLIELLADGGLLYVHGG